MSGSCAIGLYGLAVMGQNLALNIAENAKVRIAVCNRSPAKVDDCVNRAKAEGDLPVVGFKDVKEFVDSIAKPRAIILLVMAGKPVDETIEVRGAPRPPHRPHCAPRSTRAHRAPPARRCTHSPPLAPRGAHGGG
jgi:hypothetical protein